MANSELVALGKSYFRIRNYDKAMEYLGKAVMQGKTAAVSDFYQLGNYFLEQKEYTKAEKCFQILADRGHGESCLMLGTMCEQGLGRKKDVEAAFGYYGASFQQGCTMAAYRAGCLMMSDALQFEEVRDIAVTWFQEAIAGGIYKAYLQMGNLYSEHTVFKYSGTTRNDRVALSWYLRGAMKGDAECLEQAALFFLMGYGTKKDTARGVQMLIQAAHRGASFSAMQLGQMYENGMDVRKNCQKAMQWYLKASELGNQHGAYEAGRLSCDLGRNLLLTSPKNKEKILSYFQKAVEYGYFIAYLELADLAMREGKIEEYRSYLRQGTEKGEASCRHALIDWYKQQIGPLLNQLQLLAPEVDKDPSHRNKKLWKQYVSVLENMETVLRNGVADTNDENMWRLLTIWYLQHGADFGKKEKDFLWAANHLMEINESEELLVLLWFYYSGNSKDWQGAIYKENPRKAAFYARKLAKLEVDGFCEILASYYREGYGVKQNLKKAEALERKAKKS